MAVDHAVITSSIRHLHLQGAAARQCLSGQAPGVLTHGGGGQGPGAAVVQRYIDGFSTGQVGAQSPADVLCRCLGDEVRTAAARVCAERRCRDGGGRCGGVNRPDAGAAADCGDVARHIRLPDLYRACRVGTHCQGEGSGGCCLRCTPGAAAVAAVLPSRTRFHATHRDAGAARDVVRIAATRVRGQGQCGSRWRSGVQGVSLTQRCTTVTRSISHLHFQGVAAADGLPGETPGVLSHRGGGRGPVGAVVQGHQNRLAIREIGTQGAADVLRRCCGDEVAAAGTRVCAERHRGHGGGGCRGVNRPTAAVADRGRYISRHIGLPHLHRARGVGALCQGKAGGGSVLCCTPSAATVAAVLPSGTSLETTDADAGGAGDVVGIGAAGVGGQGQARGRWQRGVYRPTAGVAAGAGRHIARHIGLPHLHRTRGVRTLCQGKAGGGCSLCSTPCAATVTAVLPACTRLHAADGHAGIVGDVVTAATARIAGQGQAGGSGCCGVQGIGLAVHRAVIASSIRHLHLQGAASCECLSSQAPGVLSDSRRCGAPGAAVVQRHRHHFATSQGGTQGAADVLCRGLGDEVACAAAGICTEHSGAYRGGGSGSVNCPTAAVAARYGNIARHIGLPHLYRACGVAALCQGEAGGGCSLRCTPGTAAVSAVLPCRACLHASDRNTRVSGDVVRVAATRVTCQSQCRCAWQRGVQGIGLAVHRAIVACGVCHLYLQGVAAGECLTAQAPGVLTDGGGGRAPGAAVVQGDVDGFSTDQVGA